MLIEEPVDSLDQRKLDPEQIDWLDLTWTECATRALRKATRSGQQVRILLRINALLRHRDILLLPTDSAPAVVVNLLPCEVIAARPRDTTELAAIAFKLGDLHVPVQLLDGQIITPADGPVEAEFQQLGLPYELTIARFEPSFRSGLQLGPASTFQAFHCR